MGKEKIFNGNPPGRVEIPLKFHYRQKEGLVEIWISPFVMVLLPFDVLKNGVNEIEKIRQREDILLPDNRIIVPGA